MRKIIVLLTIVVLISGCCLPGTYMWYGARHSESMGVAKRNNDNMSKLKIGMTRGEVLQIMGSPDKTEAYTIDGKAMEFLFYRIHACNSDLYDTDANFAPIAIEKGVVSGWGRNYYDQTIKFKADIKQDISIKK